MKIAIMKDEEMGNFHTKIMCCKEMSNHYDEDWGPIYLRRCDGRICIMVNHARSRSLSTDCFPISHCPFCGAKIEVYKAQEAL